MSTSAIQQVIQDMKQRRQKLEMELRTLDAQIEKLKEALAMDGEAPLEKKKTTLEMARDVLKAAGSPMHSKAIAEEISKKFGVYVKAASLGTMLYRCAIERKKIFRKENEPENTYSLLE